MRSSDFTKIGMEKSYCYEIEDFSFVLQYKHGLHIL